MKEQLTAGILFAGGGGVECGMIDADVDPVWAVEWNPHNTRLSEALIHAHRRNFPDCKVVAKPVQQVNWRRLPRVKVLWASPMCSSFSPANQGAEETMEDIEMAMAVCDAIAILTPTYFYLENVGQYRKSVSFDAIVSTLKRLGYSVEWSVENFADYGLPQARKRLILRAALGVSVPPLPKKVAHHVGWHEAIADLIPGLPDSNLLPNQQQSVDEYLKKNPPVPLLIDRVGKRGDYKVKPGHLPANTILRSQFTDGNNRNRNRFGDIRLLSAEIKSLTIECVRRLQGFPDWYDLPAEIAIAGSILGYSVPPLFVKQLFAVLLKSDENDLATDISTCGLAISFGWTAQYLPKKSVTRRTWKDSHAAKFIRAYQRGDRVVALNKDKRNGGEQIGWCRLTVAPYKERLSEMPESDVAAEGGMVATVEEFIQKYFEGDRDLEVWVVRFEFFPIEDVCPATVSAPVYVPDDKVGQTKLAIAQSLPTLPALQGSDYKLIVCDPPWMYNLRESDATHRGRCPYPNMSDDEILDLPVGAIVAKDAYVLLWVTNNHLSLGFECLKRWGFEYKSIFTWVKTAKGSDKPNIGLGHYGRNCTEHILVGIKGKPGSFTSLGLTNIPNVLFAPRGKHSQKPEQFWEVAEKLGGKLGGKRIELFARSPRDGWESWGLEAGSIYGAAGGSGVNGDEELCKTFTQRDRHKCLTQKSRKPNVVAASGSLVRASSYKLKSGDDGSTRYLYQWRERNGRVWAVRSKHVPIGKVRRVKEAIASRQPIAELIAAVPTFLQGGEG